MNYLEFEVHCDSAYTDILQAELGEVGFNSFMNTEEGFVAYTEENELDEPGFEEVVERYNEAAKISYEKREVERKNWNEEWESHYDPIDVDGRCYVRATFHKPKPEYETEIIIIPKMSFGTGHHQTTRLMLKHELSIDFKGKRALDVGCGTGILAIMASKRGAAEVHACDNYDWAVENSEENFELNGCTNISAHQGTLVETSISGKFDVILANINKNVLLEEIEIYRTYLKDDGFLALSGFYQEDIPDIVAEAEKNGLQMVREYEEKRWVAVLFKVDKG